MGPFFARACAVATLVVFLGGCGKKESPAGGSAESKAAAAAGGLGLAFLNGFEGEIDLSFKDSSKGAKPATSLAMMIKDKKLRVDFPAEMSTSKEMGKGYAVLNTPEKKLYAVLD